MSAQSGDGSAGKIRAWRADVNKMQMRRAHCVRREWDLRGFFMRARCGYCLCVPVCAAWQTRSTARNFAMKYAAAAAAALCNVLWGLLVVYALESEITFSHY